MSEPHLVHVWGYDLKLHDPNSVTIPMIIKDFEQNQQSCRDLKFTPNTILDIGAHVGLFSILMSKRYPESNIYAVEPVKKNFDSLIKNIKLNNCKNIFPNNYAVSNKTEKVNLFQHPLNTGSSSLFNDQGWDNHEVDAFTLDGVVNDIPFDLVKIDIEGMEYSVLNAFTSWSNVKHLTVEMHTIDHFTREENQKLAKNFTDFLKSKMPKENLSYITEAGGEWYYWGEKRELPDFGTYSLDASVTPHGSATS